MIIKHWLGPDAEIIQDKFFERAIERLHSGDKIDDLPQNLKRKLEHFKRFHLIQIGISYLYRSTNVSKEAKYHLVIFSLQTTSLNDHHD